MVHMTLSRYLGLDWTTGVPAPHCRVPLPLLWIFRNLMATVFAGSWHLGIPFTILFESRDCSPTGELSTSSTRSIGFRFYIFALSLSFLAHFSA